MTDEQADIITRIFNEQWPVDSSVFVISNGLAIWSAIEQPAEVFYCESADFTDPIPVPAVKVRCSDRPVALAEIVPYNRNPKTEE